MLGTETLRSCLSMIILLKGVRSFWSFHRCISWLSLLGASMPYLMLAFCLCLMKKKWSNNWSKPRWCLEKKFEFWSFVWERCLISSSLFEWCQFLYSLCTVISALDNWSWHFTKLQTLWALTIVSGLMVSSFSRPLHFTVERTAKIQKLIPGCLNICGKEFVCNCR